MLFNSYGFIFLFLPITVIGFFWAARSSAQLAALWLVFASLFFYAFWNPPFVLLLIASIIFNFQCGRAIVASCRQRTRQRFFLATGVSVNLLVLAFFKYALFLVASVTLVTGANIHLPKIILPLGISFYSFTQIAFLVDAADGLVTEVDMLRYFVFVTYFPHLIAGPVLHHQQVMPQFAKPRAYRWNWNSFALGVAVFTIGLAKKVLIADGLAEYADGIFNAIPQGATPKLIGAWAGALAYSFQLYFDFSGYSDMAVGLSMFFNVRLPYNFNSPYKAASVIEFWRRWHMTLSQFLRDYLYIRLGGNRKGEVRRYANLLITMLLGGLWHGASWTFVAWGGLHGLFLLINHLWQKLRVRLGIQIGTRLGVVLTFGCVLMAWVLFRSESFSAARTMFASMLGVHGVSLPPALAGIAANLGIQASFNGIFERNLPPFASLGVNRYCALMLLSVWLVFTCPNTQELLLMGRLSPIKLMMVRYPRLLGVVMGILFCVTLANLDQVSTFLYYQF